MKIIKVYNNNIVATITPNGREVLVTGPGIGFGKKVGQKIDKNRAKKFYYFENVEKNRIHELLESTPGIYFEISMSILTKARQSLKKNISETLLVGLTDHISYAVERFQDGIELPNLILEETKLMYPDEYKVALWSLQLIKQKLNVDLPEDEAGYITMHIVNSITQSEDTSDLMLFVKEMLDIISSQMQITYDKNSISYYRIVTHLKYFYQRIMYHEELSLNQLSDIFHTLLNDNIKIKKCITEINDFLLKEYHYECSETEQLYLMIHILKIIS